MICPKLFSRVRTRSNFSRPGSIGKRIRDAGQKMSLPFSVNSREPMGVFSCVSSHPSLILNLVPREGLRSQKGVLGKGGVTLHVITPLCCRSSFASIVVPSSTLSLHTTRSERARTSACLASFLTAMVPRREPSSSCHGTIIGASSTAYHQVSCPWRSVCN